MGKVQDQQQRIAETQITKIEATLSDGHKFKRRGNEEQFKHNHKILSKIKEADNVLDANNPSQEGISKAKEKLAEGMSLLDYRQKIIKIADSSDLGWRVVQEYEANPLADDSEDERKLFKAESRAERKVKAEKSKKTKRTHPYVTPATDKFAQRQKPGRCFNCGVKGHWKQECPDLKKSEKISISDNNKFEFGFSNQTDTGNALQLKSVIVTPVNSLRNHIDKWKSIEANQYILNIIDQGYRLPFKTLPVNISLDNNRSAKDNKSFVSDEIDKLLMKGCISRVELKPHVVNPLTVAGNKTKLRLVLDCRHINPHLYQFKYKYEDATVARQMFYKGDFLFSYDLKSAYHHIMMHPMDITYLGFQWKSKFYVFKVLCFGLATAGFIFSKVLRELIKYWRSKSIRIIMYLDDGLGGADTFEKCKDVSLVVKNDLFNFGFIIAEEKSNWNPVQESIWLGLIWYTVEGKIRVTQDRIDKILSCLRYICSNLQTTRVIPVGLLASVIGQLISTQAVLGKSIRLRTRYAYDCVLDRLSWDSPIWLTHEAEGELRFWLENIEKMNFEGSYFSQLTVEACKANMFSDASGVGYGGYIAKEAGKSMLGEVYGA